MAGVSKNGFDLIGDTFVKLKGKLGRAFLATLIMIAPLMLCCFTVYGIAAAVIIFAVFQVGYIRYMRDLIDGKNPSFCLIFSEFSEPWLEIFLGLILVSLYSVGYVLFIIPGIMMVGIFGMSIFFAEYKKSKTPFDALKSSFKHMRGNHSNMFGYKVFYWIIYLVVISLSAVGVLFVIKLWSDYKLWSILLALGLYIVSTLVWSLITVYYHVSNELFFRELLLYFDYKESKKRNKKVAIIEEQKMEVEEKVEENIIPDKKIVRKASTRSTTVKQPVKSTTTKSTTTRKTTTKKIDK